MTQVTANSHYIARHLTKPWEFTHPKSGPRQLWYYDFDRAAFDVRSGRRLYIADVPWPQRVEEFLRDHLETPLAAYLARYVPNRKVEPTQKELLAMKLAVMLQPQRTMARNGEPERMELLANKGEGYLWELVAEADKRYTFVTVPLRKEALFFPETGLLAIPLAGSKPALALPIHPGILFAAVDRPSGHGIAQLSVLKNDHAWLMTISAGLEPCRRIVIPGSLWGRHTEEELLPVIQAAREDCAEMTLACFKVNLALYGDTTPDPAAALAIARRRATNSET